MDHQQSPGFDPFSLTVQESLTAIVAERGFDRGEEMMIMIIIMVTVREWIFQGFGLWGR